MKYKVLDIIEKDLVKELESQAKQGYEFVEILGIKEPGAYSNDRSYKVLLRKK